MGVRGLDLSGKKFGHLTVIEKVKVDYGKYKWRCVCDCGNENLVRTDHLIGGDAKSCGCQHFEACKTHGMSNTRLYHIWCTMKARCNNPNSQKYHRYGARGIKMCDSWLNSFQDFYDWSMTNGYADDLSIDRIDNNAGYFPDNCRWATCSEQSNNTSRNRILCFDGIKGSLTQMATRYGLEPSVVSQRLKRGWNVEDALTKSTDQAARGR